MKKISFIILFLALGLTTLNCGYVTSGSTLASHLKTVHITSFKNDIGYTIDTKRSIYLPLLEVDVRNAIIDRFIFDGNLRIAEEDEADLVLRGKLINYERSTLRKTDSDDVLEYRVHVIVSLELWDAHKREIAWSEPNFVGEATYFVSGSQASTEESAVDKAIIDLARRVVERLIEDW